MNRHLHIITRPDDGLAGEIIAGQQKDHGAQVRVIDLSVGEVDYAELLEEIFRSDSVAVW